MSPRIAPGPEAGPETRLDPEMRQYLALSAQAAAGFGDPFRLPIEQARDVIERTQRPFAEGGPAMFATDEIRAPIRGRTLLMRRHRPRPGTRPCLVYLHGGGWVWNSIDTHDRVARELAAASGFTVIVPDYAMAPETPFPGPLKDCVAVIRWLHAHATPHDIEAGRIFVAGDSAGANLALAAALALRDAGEPIVKGALLNYGAFAPRFDTGSYQAYGTSALSPQTWKMEFFWRHYLASPEDDANPLAAPLLADLTGLAPLRLQVAELDVLHDENIALAEKARAQGVATETEVYPGVTHGFLRAVGHVETAARAIRDGAEWLRRTV